jgi:hypothetical protein
MSKAPNLLIFLCIYAISGLLSLKAFSLAEEPQKISPETDPRLIRSFQLDNAPENWNEPVINLLVVGRDAPMELPFPMIDREDGTSVKRLASRGDATLLISMNRLTGKTTIFTLERDIADSGDNNEILTHQYILRGRGHFVRLVKNRVTSMIQQMKQERQFLSAQNQLHIQGILELDFESFKKILTNVRENILSSAKVAWAFRAHSSELMSLLQDEKAVLKKLRARKQFKAASYQRSLDHAMFVSSILGLISYTRVESAEKDFLSADIFRKSFESLSRTFNYNDLLRHMNTANGASVLDMAGYSNGESQVDIHLLGVHPEASASLINGKIKARLPEGAPLSDTLLLKLRKEPGQVFTPKNCSLCSEVKP